MCVGPRDSEMPSMFKESRQLLGNGLSRASVTDHVALECDQGSCRRSHPHSIRVLIHRAVLSLCQALLAMCACCRLRRAKKMTEGRY